MQAVEAVASGRADALVSGGSTGAALAASLFRFKRARGVHRPALAIVVPVPGSPFLLLDAGANVAVRPEHLVQFAHMGAAFMEVVMGVQRPRVALLSNGEEPTRGPEDVVAAHAALSENPGAIDFVGNVEGFAIGKGVCDVLVADGYAGNVALKVMEGTSDVLLRSVRDAAMSSTRSKLGGLLLGRRCAGCATRSTPRRTAARCCSACAASAWSRTAPSARAASRARSRSPRAACATTCSGARTSGWPRPGRCAARPEPSAAAATLPDQS